MEAVSRETQCPKEQNRNSNLQSSVSRMEIPLGGLQAADSVAGAQQQHRPCLEYGKPPSHRLVPQHWKRKTAGELRDRAAQTIHLREPENRAKCVVGLTSEQNVAILDWVC